MLSQPHEKFLSKFLWKIMAKFLCKILRKCVSLKERSPFLSGALDRRVDETRKRVGKGREGTDGVCYYCLVGRRASMYIVVPHQSHFGLNSHRTSRLSSNPRKRGNFRRHFTTFPSKRKKKLLEWVSQPFYRRFCEFNIELWPLLVFIQGLKTYLQKQGKFR